MAFSLLKILLTLKFYFHDNKIWEGGYTAREQAHIAKNAMPPGPCQDYRTVDGTRETAALSALAQYFIYLCLMHL